MQDNALFAQKACTIQDWFPPNAGAVGHTVGTVCCSRPDHNDAGKRIIAMANHISIGGPAPSRNHFPLTVARLNVQASFAVLQNLCCHAHNNGVSLEQIAAFLGGLEADCRTLVEAVERQV